MPADDHHIRATRWLYDDEKSYRKAAAKLKLEELKARKEKALIRQYRRRQRRIWSQKLQTSCRPLASKLKKVSTAKRAAYAAGTLIVVGTMWGGYRVISSSKQSTDDTMETLGANTVQPDFKPAVPKEADASVNATENNQHKIVSYQDTFAGAQLIVSQQKLPENFMNDPNAITKLEQFKAAEMVDTPKGKLYLVGNDTGQQWAAIGLNDILLFIQSNKKIVNEEWRLYIANLEIR